jgi:anti-sigma28 factor (negative regulator of flagellin synthesis)
VPKSQMEGHEAGWRPSRRCEMKITNEHVGRLLGARLERVESAQRPAPSAGAEGSDRAVFSSRSEDVRLGMAAARAAGKPDEARLEGLAEQVRSGKYRVPAEVLAEAVLRDR